MRVTGDVSEKESKVLNLLGCKESLKSLEGIPFKVIGAVLDTDTKTSDKGEVYRTQYVKLDVGGSVAWYKFTQTIVGDTFEKIISEGLTDIEWTVDYTESASGNRYLTVSMA